jgi:hypothetical protein
VKINVIGDIAGRYNELMELLAKMPPADLTLAVGDLVDRGPKSKEVIEWFMGDPLSRECVHANHENMMLDACHNFPGSPHEHPYWCYNGGTATLASYMYAPVPEAHLRWMANRPLWFKSDGLFVSHAPVRDITRIPPEFDDWQKFCGDESTWPWNRYLSPKPMPNHFMVYGHNSHYREHHYTQDDGEVVHYASCIDNSACKELMGMHWPTRETFSVEYHR